MGSEVKQVKNLSSAANLAGISGSTSIEPNRYSSHLRSSWVLTCRDWLSSYRYINLFVNPSEVQWSFPRREQMTKTAAGVVRNTWRNRYRNTYYDEPTLNITFQSGNIMPSAGLSDAALSDPRRAEFYYDTPAPPPGLLNYYEFMELLDQPMLNGNVENYHIMLYRSRIFPRMRLEGYFIGTSPITLTDTSTGANSFTWTAAFQVYRSYPAFNNFSLLVNEWSNWARSNVIGEIFPPGFSAITSAEQADVLRRQDAKLAVSSPTPSSKTPNKAPGLVAGSVAGAGKTAQSPGGFATYANAKKQLDAANAANRDRLSAIQDAKALGLPDVPSYSLKAATSDPLKAGAKVGSTAVNANKAAASSPFAKGVGVF